MGRRYSKGSRDANEPEIVQVLENAGASVIRLAPGEIADLLVGYRRTNYLLEIKNPETKPNKDMPTKAEREPGQPYHGCHKAMSRSQFDAIKKWRGHFVAVVEMPEEAMRAIRVCERCWQHPAMGIDGETREGLCVDCEMTQARGY